MHSALINIYLTSPRLKPDYHQCFAMTITVDTIQPGNSVKNWALEFLIPSKILRVFEWFGNLTASVHQDVVVFVLEFARFLGVSLVTV